LFVKFFGFWDKNPGLESPVSPGMG
jgi:hypothetical protein